ncbi:hypothetical protein [Halostella sp. PRR32]|uniref:DUF7344 domain-containing protein n=1 Tax=Halostella sp. PRR32 TaxID=3098147 RepID=UPI002B1D7310|nr:hypothetical protein [Halostella sp. PRR32]
MANDSGSPTVMCSEESDVSNVLDTTFELLARERRRTVLYCLRASDGQLSLSELVDRVAEREAAESAPDDDQQETAISLSQVHLPKLADAGVIEYDRQEQLVEHEGDPFVETFLDRADKIER